MVPATVTDLDDAELAALLVRCGAIQQTSRVASTKVLSAKPGRRATYLVELRRPADRLVVKLYGDHDKATTAAAAIRSLARHLPPGSPHAVPGVVAQLHGVVVLRAVDGRPLDALLRDRSAALAGRSAGRWLARLHRSEVVLDRTLDLESEWRTLESWLAALADSTTVSPHLVDVVRRELLIVGPPRSSALVPIHKDFHYGHVLVGPDSATTVVDFDEARMGPPDLDVAHFVVNLGALGLLEHRSGHRIATQQFLRTYGAETGWRQSAHTDWWRAYCFVKLAWQAASCFGPPPVGEGRAHPEHTIVPSLLALSRSAAMVRS